MFHKTTLKNGLRIITVPSKNTQAVTVLVLVGTGSKYETKEINGISHFLEHMFFKGTKRRPNTLDIAEELDKVGGEYNAFTGKEYTGYWAKVDYKHLDLVLDVVSDIFLNSKLDAEEISREKGVIIEEINMYLDMPMRYIGDLWEKLLYGNQPAGWNIAGEKEVVANLKREQFVKYIGEHYTAENTIVIVAGRINKNDILGKIKKYFSGINTAKPPLKPGVREKQAKPGLLVHYKKTDQTHICLGCRAYDVFHKDKYALGLLAIILGGNMSSRLFISVRERQGLAYYVKTEIQAYTDSGYFVAQAGVDNSKTEKAIQAILNEYKKIAQKGVGASELKKAKDYTKGSAILNLESSDDWASFVGTQEIITGESLTLEEKFVKIDAVTEKDIKRVAKEIFRPEKLNLAMIGPFRDKKRFEGLLKI